MSDKMCVLVPAVEAARELSWEARDWGRGSTAWGTYTGRWQADTKGQESAWAHLPFPKPWECSTMERLYPKTSKRDFRGKLGVTRVSYVCANPYLLVATVAVISDTQKVFVLFKVTLVD